MASYQNSVRLAWGMPVDYAQLGARLQAYCEARESIAVPTLNYPNMFQDTDWKIVTGNCRDDI